MRTQDHRPSAPPGGCSESRCWRVLGIALLAGAVLAALSQAAYAIPRVERYVNISVSPEELDLGSVPQPGAYVSPSELKVHVTANCAHGGVMATATPLKLSEGIEIPLERFFVRIPATGQFVPMVQPVLITGPMNPGVFDLVLKFRVETLLEDPAGNYTGTITFTVGP